KRASRFKYRSLMRSGKPRREPNPTAGAKQAEHGGHDELLCRHPSGGGRLPPEQPRLPGLPQDVGLEAEAFGADENQLLWAAKPQAKEVVVGRLLQAEQRIVCGILILRGQEVADRLIDVRVAVAARIPTLRVLSDVPVRAVEVEVGEAGKKPVGVSDQVVFPCGCPNLGEPIR